MLDQATYLKVTSILVCGAKDDHMNLVFDVYRSADQPDKISAEQALEAFSTFTDATKEQIKQWKPQSLKRA